MAFTGSWGQWYEEAEHPRGQGGKWTSKGGAQSVADDERSGGPLRRLRTTSLQDRQFTRDEQAAIEEYVDYVNFEEINYNLRHSRGLRGEDKKLADDLASAISKSTLPNEIEVYRGITETEDNFGRNPGKEFVAKLNQLNVGSIIKDN